MAEEDEEMIDATYSAEQVERLLCCPICLDRFTNPRILPCQHTFCKSPCLEGLVDMRNRKIKCPECRQEHYVPHSGAGGFPPNITIANFLDLPTQRSQNNAPSTETSNTNPAPPAGGSANKCGVCESESQTVRCFHCNKLVCDSCKRSHCGQMKLDVTRLLNQIRRAVPKLSNSISSVEQKCEQVKQQVEQVKSEVSDQIDGYIRELKERQRLLHSELDTLLQGELRSLRLHQENLEVELASISSYCDSTEAMMNQPELDLAEADLVSHRRQCVEYMEQIRRTETTALPNTRTVRFRHNGRTLHQSIITFGEVVEDNPSERRYDPPAEAANLPSRTNDNSQAQRRRWEAVTPVDRSFLENMRTSYAPSPSPSQRSRRTLSPPAHWQSAQEPEENPRATRSSTDYRSYFSGNYTGSDTVPPARISDYMFAIDTQGSAARGRDRAAASMFARERNGERMAALVGGGPHAVGGSPFTGYDAIHSENLNNNTNNGRNRRREGQGSSPPFLPRLQRDPRPTEYYEVDMDGNFSLVSLPEAPAAGRTRGRGQGRGNHGNRGTTNEEDQITEEQIVNEFDETVTSQNRTSSNETASDPVVTNGETAASQATEATVTTNPAEAGPSNPTSADNSQTAAAAADTAQGGSNNDNTDSERSPEELRLRNRRGTFVRDDGPESEAGALPQVGDSSTRIDIPLNRTMDAEEMHNLIQQAANSLTTDRPLVNYQGKGEVVQKIGGERGSGEGKFKLPRGVAVSPNNDSVVVADSSNHRVQVFDCNGQFVKTFGSYGDGEGEFDCLAGVAISQNGDIIISDRYNHRIQMFDRYGTFKKKFGREGSTNGKLNYPWGLAVDARGLIYVCDKENHRVQVFGADGTFIRKFGGLGSNNGQLENPYYLCVTSDNKVVVSDTNNHRIQIFNTNGRFLQVFGSQGSANGKFKSPKGVAVDNEGFIIVADSGNHRIQVFRGDGRFYYKFGTRGRGDGQFKEPEGLALTSSGKIIVSDKDNYRIQIL